MPAEDGVVRDSEAGGFTLKEALEGTLDKRAEEAANELLSPANEVQEVTEEVEPGINPEERESNW